MDLLDFTAPEKKVIPLKDVELFEEKAKMESDSEEKEIQINNKLSLVSTSPEQLPRKIIRPIPTQAKLDVDGACLRDSIAKLSEILAMQLMACSYI